MLTRPDLCSRTWPRTVSLTLTASFATARYASSRSPLINIKNGTFYRQYPTLEHSTKDQNPAVFTNLNFSLPGAKDAVQKWAVIGNSGRTELFDVLRGQYICHPPDARSYPYLNSRDVMEKSPRFRSVGDPIQFIGFSGEGSSAAGGTRGAYLSARYESHREETDWTLRQYLKGQTSLNPLEEDPKGKLTRDAQFAKAADNLGLSELLDMPVANLSNGQMRRARIAKGLLNRPELLLLDDPFVGLDPSAAKSISHFLYRLATSSNPRLILGLRPQDSVPDWITHILILGESNRILFQDDRDKVVRGLHRWSTHPAHVKFAPASLKDQNHMQLARVHSHILYDLNLIERRTATFKAPSPPEGDPLIEMGGVYVAYGDKPALGNWKQNVGGEQSQGLHWTVRRGQRWAVLGANGSGKTTLLSLVTSDHPQAYALPVRHFGRSRLAEPGKPAISLFELQSRIGHSSPEIHAVFPRQLTIRQALESAFADAFLSRPKLNHNIDLDINSALRYFKSDLDPNHDNSSDSPATPPESDEVNDQAKELLVKFPPKRGKKPTYIPEDHDTEYADSIRFGELSTTQQRVVLFLRALISKPDVILLDEAFAGMTVFLRDKCINFLEVGEKPSSDGITAPRRMRKIPHQTKDPYESPFEDIRHHGISDDQALISISHVKEEIPDIVRNFIRLPSKPVAGEALDFSFGKLNSSSAISDPKVWSAIWSPDPSQHFRAVKGKQVAEKEAHKRHPDDEKFDWVYL